MSFFNSAPTPSNISLPSPDFTCLQSSVAYYGHLNQIIQLQINTSSFLTLLEKWKRCEDVNDIVKDLLRPVVHEFRHWVDMHCTPGGLSILNYIFRLAKNSKDRKAIWEVKKNISLEVFKDKSVNTPELPWRIVSTRSIPVFFEQIEHLSLCFFKGNERRHFCKSPLYLGSMLEVNAVWQELIEGVALSRNDESWVVEKRVLTEEFSKFVYDSKLPEYHSLAHFVALQKGEPDVLTAYRMASAISAFILMMPDDFLRTSAEKCAFELNKDAKYRDVIRLNREWPREILYYFIVMNLHKLTNYNDVNEIFTLLPFWKNERNNYFDLMYDGYCKKLRSMANEFGGYFESISNALRGNAQRLAEQKSLNPLIMGLKRPPIYLNGGTIPGDDEFSGYEDYFSSIPDTEMAMAIKIDRQ